MRINSNTSDASYFLFLIPIGSIFTHVRLISIFLTHNCINVIYKLTCPISNAYNKCQQEYIGITTTTLKRRITSHKYNGSIKQHLMDHHSLKIDQEKVENNVKIIDKASNRKQLYIREALLLNSIKPAINIQYKNFSSILRLHCISSNTTRNPCSKQEVNIENTQVIPETRRENVTNTETTPDCIHLHSPSIDSDAIGLFLEPSP